MEHVDFHPPRALRHPHLQSMLASMGPRKRRARRLAAGFGATAPYLLNCGDGVRLQGFLDRPPGEPRSLVMMLHGWEGCADSTYMLCATRRLLDEGHAVFRLNFRDHGATHHLNEGVFHSCRLAEVVGAARRVAELVPVRPLFLAGFSLGGNFALRVACAALGAGIPLARVLAVCPVVSPARGLEAMEASTLFHHYFLKKWRRSLRRKQAAFPHLYDFAAGLKLHGVRELTAWMVERHSEFATMEDYLDGYSIAGDRLAGLEVPATVLTAADDPVIPVADFHQLHLPGHAELVITRHGGHCGFIGNWRLQSWAEDFLAHRLRRGASGH